MKTTQNKNPFKAGDLVERFQGGFNDGKEVGDKFVVSKVCGNVVYDDNKGAHDHTNLRLITPKSEIINDYNIF